MCKCCVGVVTVELCGVQCVSAGTVVLARTDWDKICLSTGQLGRVSGSFRACWSMIKHLGNNGLSQLFVWCGFMSLGNGNSKIIRCNWRKSSCSWAGLKCIYFLSLSLSLLPPFPSSHALLSVPSPLSSPLLQLRGWTQTTPVKSCQAWVSFSTSIWWYFYRNPGCL